MRAGSAPRHARRALRPGDEGSTVVEVVVLAPALALLIGLIIAGGRLAVAHQAVESSAAAAARAASIARTQADAEGKARDAAVASLDAQNLTCQATAITLDASGFAAPVGAPASVSATVTCQVELADTAPGLPGTLTVTSTVASPIDTYRER